MGAKPCPLAHPISVDLGRLSRPMFQVKQESLAGTRSQVKFTVGANERVERFSLNRERSGAKA